MTGTAQILGWSILVSLMQAAILWVVVSLAMRLLPTRRATLRHGIALGALLTALWAFLSTAGLMLSDWHRHTACWRQAETPGVLAPAACRSHGVPAKDLVPTSHAQKMKSVLFWVPGVWTPPGERWRTWARAATGAAGVLGAAWLASLLLLGVGEVRARRLLRRVLRDSHPVRDQRVEVLLQGLRTDLGVRVPVTLRTSSAVSAPCVAGVTHAVILVPAALLAALDRDELRAVLAHELAHVRRRDAPATAIMRLAGLLLWFNPFVTWIARRTAEEREAACDDVGVAHGTGSRVAYAEMLLTLEGLRSLSGAGRPALPLLGERGLLGRIRRLTAARPARPAPRAGMLLVVVFAGLAAGALSRSTLNIAALGSWAIMAQDIHHHMAGGL